MSDKLILHCYNEDETRGIGRTLGRALVPGLTVLLCGDLGSGKTVLVRGVGDALGVAHVKSPSFTLVNEYRLSDANNANTENTNGINLIAHADLYRLDDHDRNNQNGVDALGLDEYISGDAVLFVEWSERWANAPTRDVITINFESPDENSRVLKFTGVGLGEKVIRVLTALISKTGPEA